MTLAVAVHLPERGICLVADSVVTSQTTPLVEQLQINADGNIVRSDTQTSGYTSMGERFQAVSRGAVTYYAEAACKIGRFGPDMFAAFAGSELFARELTRRVTEIDRIVARLPQSFIRECAEAVAPNLPTGCCVEMLIGGKTNSNETILLRGVVEKGTSGISVSFDACAPSTVYAIGSGAAELTALDRQQLDFFATKPLPHAVCLRAHFYGAMLRQRLRNEAVGVGGAYFGAGIVLRNEDGASGFMPDVLEIHISRQGFVTVLSKIICRRPGFFVHDYMQGVTGVFPIVNYADTPSRSITQAFPEFFEREFSNLDAQCLIIDNECSRLGIPIGQITVFTPQRFSRMVGWTTDTPVSQLAIQVAPSQYIRVPRER